MSLLGLSLVVLTVGLISATRTDNVPVAGYYPGIIVSGPRLARSPFQVAVFTFPKVILAPFLCSQLSFGAFLGIVGIHLVENRRPMVSLQNTLTTRVQLGLKNPKTSDWLVNVATPTAGKLAWT